MLTTETPSARELRPAMNAYELEHICSYSGLLAASPEVIGAVPAGMRVNFYSVGGDVTGPRIRGKVLSVGGDWFTVRTDGIGCLNVRTTFQTDDGALIDVRYEGIVDFGEDGYERFVHGELPEVARIRTSPQFLTADPKYRWLNRLFCVGVGEFRARENAARYDVYAMR
jgi:hypothetical protein